MDEKEARHKLLKYCDREIDSSGWWIFGKKKLIIEYTRLLEPWQKTANIPLPDQISFANFDLNAGGIDLGSSKFNWDEIAATAFKIEMLDGHADNKPIELRHLLVCTHEGEIFDYSLGITDYYKGQLGHFIETYKRGYTGKLPG